MDRSEQRGTSGPPRVDAIIAVHSPQRQVERAVSSVLSATSVRTRVTVVVHNTPLEGIRGRLGTLADDPRVRLLELHDGIRSPAGPMNLGYDAATGEYTCLIGSDDELEHGALDAWIAAADRFAADVVIAPHRKVDGAIDAYPPVRARRTLLDGVRDRLAYRSAPLGLVSRSRFAGLRLAEGLGSGEDIPFVTSLWYSGARVCFPTTAPAYLEHVDATDRVTFAPRSFDDGFAFLDVIESSPIFAALTPAQRTALVVKLFRIHVFDAISARATDEGLDTSSRHALAAVIDHLETWAPRARGLLAIADHRALRTALDPESTGEKIRRALDARWQYRSVPAMLPANPFRALSRQAPFRTLAAGSRVAREISSAASSSAGA